MAANIDDKTRVQLFAVLSVVPVIVGFVAWLTMVYVKAEAAEKINEKQDAKLEAQYMLLIDIRDRVIKIEANQK
jgi:hypothetical protein